MPYKGGCISISFQTNHLQFDTERANAHCIWQKREACEEIWNRFQNNFATNLADSEAILDQISRFLRLLSLYFDYFRSNFEYYRINSRSIVRALIVQFTQLRQNSKEFRPNPVIFLVAGSGFGVLAR